MTSRSKATTHADDCWGWGPKHYECAVAEIERLRCIISDIKDWDCDVSGGFLSIPVDLRRRMQEAIDAHPQPASDVAPPPGAPINVIYTDGNGACRRSPEDCLYGVSYVTVADTVYWPLSADDAQRLRSAECGMGDFTGPANECPDVSALVALLEHAQCPNCDGSGARHDNYGELEQCQWCYERDAALAAHRKQGEGEGE